MNLVVLALLAMLALQPIVQTRGAPPAVVVEGIVVRAGSNEPVARATVTVLREGVHWAAIDDAESLTQTNVVARTTSLEKGNFTVRVPAGRYTLTAAKEGYLSSDYGARGSNSLGMVLVASADRKTDDVVLRLVSAGERAIHGVVSAPLGEPQAGVSVQAYRLRYTWNGRRLARVQTVLTNDLGEYRLFGLNPGQYYVAADFSREAQSVAATTGVRLTPNLSNPDDGFATFYFPDATTPTAAAPVRVGPGMESGNVNIPLKDTPRFLVRGRVTIPAFALSAQSIEVLVSPAEILFDADSAPKIHPNASGEFEFKAAPGYYVVTARMQIGERQYSSGPIQVGVVDRNIDNLVLPIAPSVDASGRLTIEGIRTVSDPTGAVVSLVNINGNGERTKRAIIAARDGPFDFFDIPPGDYELLASVPGYYVKSISYGSRDVLSAPLRIGPETNGRIDVVMSSAGASVEGRALGLSGDPTVAAQIVLVPEERFRKREDRYLFASTDRAGHFEISGIPAGNYTAFAFEEIEPGAWYDPAFNRSFNGRGVVIRADANNRATVELKTISAADAGAGR